MTRRSALLIPCLLLCGLNASAQDSPIALICATVYPVSSAPIRQATVVIALNLSPGSRGRVGGVRAVVKRRPRACDSKFSFFDRIEIQIGVPTAP